jgi:hypothetical protein
METPEIVRYGDGHFRRTIYGIGPYIADYPEQVLLACIVQGWCPRLGISWLSVGRPYQSAYNRCDAHWSDLDNNIGGRCAHVLTEALSDALGTKTLWNDYGIVDGIMVSLSL